MRNLRLLQYPLSHRQTNQSWLRLEIYTHQDYLTIHRFFTPSIGAHQGRCPPWNRRLDKRLWRRGSTLALAYDIAHLRRYPKFVDAH